MDQVFDDLPRNVVARELRLQSIWNEYSVVYGKGLAELVGYMARARKLNYAHNLLLTRWPESFRDVHRPETRAFSRWLVTKCTTEEYEILAQYQCWHKGDVPDDEEGGPVYLIYPRIISAHQNIGVAEEWVEFYGPAARIAVKCLT